MIGLGKLTKEQVMKALPELLASGEITAEDLASVEPLEPKKEEATPANVGSENPIEPEAEPVVPEKVEQEENEDLVPEIDYKNQYEELKKAYAGLDSRIAALEEKILKGADFGARVVSNPSQESPQKHILAGHGSYD